MQVFFRCKFSNLSFSPTFVLVPAGSVQIHFIDAELKALYHQSREREIISGWRVETGRGDANFLKTDKMKKPLMGANCVMWEERAKKQQETDILQKMWLSISPYVS